MQLKSYPFVIRYVLDPYKTKKMFNRAILENGGMRGSVPNQDKTQKMCNKPGGNYAHALEFLSDQCKTQEMWDNVNDYSID